MHTCSMYLLFLVTKAHLTSVAQYRSQCILFVDRKKSKGNSQCCDRVLKFYAMTHIPYCKSKEIDVLEKSRVTYIQ